MEIDWDKRAKRNALRYIAIEAWRNAEEFDRSGANDAQKLLHNVIVDKEATALEIGLGIGRITKHLANRFREVYGTDVSNEMVKQARARLRHLSNVKIDKNNGKDLRIYPDRKFDFVFSVKVLQHLPRRIFLGYLDEVRRVIKPTGIFRFQIFERTRMAAIIPWFWLRNLRRLHLKFWADPPDYDTWTARSYSREELTRILEAKGFTDITMMNPSGTEGDLWVTARPRLVTERVGL